MNIKNAVLAFVFTLSAALSAFAQSQMVGTLKIENPTIRLAPPNAPVSAGYLSITNLGEEADRLIAASTRFSKKAEIHEMKMDAGIMKMRQLEDGLSIEPGETVQLKPGGYHLMFMVLNKPMQKGATHRVSLTFEKAGNVDVDFTVGVFHTDGHNSMKMEEK